MCFPKFIYIVNILAKLGYMDLKLIEMKNK